MWKREATHNAQGYVTLVGETLQTKRRGAICLMTTLGFKDNPISIISVQLLATISLSSHSHRQLIHLDVRFWLLAADAKIENCKIKEAVQKMGLESSPKTLSIERIPKSMRANFVIIRRGFEGPYSKRLQSMLFMMIGDMVP
jgi:hypothetical protein